MILAITALALATAVLPVVTPASAAPDAGTITLRPAAEPTPALKYRLTPERRFLQPGNAATFYHRAMHLMLANRPAPDPVPSARPGTRTPSVEEQIMKWIGGPIQDIPRDEARKRLDFRRNVLKEVELGAQRRDCDWDFWLRDEAYALMLPEIQEMRSLARLVALRARLAILDGETDEAFRWIQIGLTMGRHAAEGPILIQALVGLAIDALMVDCLEQWIQIPGSPSVYWAFADRPRPFIDMTGPLEGECYLLEKVLPELLDLDRSVWSLDQARRFTRQLDEHVFTLFTGEPIPGTGVALPRGLSSTARRLGIAAMAAKVYPDARRALIAAGRPEAEVDAMPVIQAAALQAYRDYQRRRDNRFKWVNVPYWQSAGRLNQSDFADVHEKLANPLLTMFLYMTSNLDGVRLAALRFERRLDALQCVEAIRLHAARHGGKLPDSLEALTDAPAPLDPATGTPFHYERSGNSATLSGPTPAGINISGPEDSPVHAFHRIRYHLQLAD
jgi:hypothetical protein